MNHNKLTLPKSLSGGDDEGRIIDASSSLGYVSTNFSTPNILSGHQATNTETIFDTKRKVVQEAIDSYIRFIPRINDVIASTFGELLVDVLKETENEVSLNDFFRLLYTFQSSNSLISVLKESPHELSNLETKSKGLVLCRLIYDTFMHPLSAATHFGVDSEKLSASNINPHEFHRVFLAIKILLHCLKEVDEPSQKESSLTKTSIFNIYQIYCFRLLSQNPANLDESSIPESLILGQSSTGKLMRIVFKNVGSKRLGKRGCSKYHFTGVKWRETVLDHEISQLINLEPSQVMSKFREISRGMTKNVKPSMGMSIPSVPKRDLIAHSSEVSQPLFSSVPLLSYVNSSSRFPAEDFSPRIKDITPRRVPQQTEWFRRVMQRSVNVLKSYNVNLEQAINDFQSGDFSVWSERSLYHAVCQAEMKLDQNSSSEDAYLHLHLTVLTLVLPTVLASDEEIRPASKILLRECLRSFVKELEGKGSSWSPFEKNHRRIFISNMQKLIYISETISVGLPHDLATHVLQGIIQSIGDVQKDRTVSFDGTVLENLCSRAVIIMLNAHFEFLAISEQQKISLTIQIVEFSQKIFAELNMNFSRMLNDIDSDVSNFKVECLRFEMFKSFTEAFHNWISHMPSILDTPMSVLRFYFNQVDRTIQSMNFQAFGKLHPQLATETFKTWWLITAAFHEYFTIVSEIVALSQRLNKS